MTACEPWFATLRRRLRCRRVKLLVHSPETQRLVETMQERIDREHRWVHRLEDEIASLRKERDDLLAALRYVSEAAPISDDAVTVAKCFHRVRGEARHVLQARAAHSQSVPRP